MLFLFLLFDRKIIEADFPSGAGVNLELAVPPCGTVINPVTNHFRIRLEDPGNDCLSGHRKGGKEKKEACEDKANRQR